MTLRTGAIMHKLTTQEEPGVKDCSKIKRNRYFKAKYKKSYSYTFSLAKLLSESDVINPKHPIISNVH